MSGNSVAMRVQQMQQKGQALVLGRIVQSRSGTGFLTRQLADLYDDLSIPAPKNLTSVLTRLESDGAMLRGNQGWKLTPSGWSDSVDLLAEEDAPALVAEAEAVAAPMLGSLRHPVLPPALAPPGALVQVRRFLDKHPFETNVFGMTRFPNQGETPDPIQEALDAARKTCAENGFTFHLASDGAMLDDLWGNVMAYMWACKFGIAFFESRTARGLNYNMSIEVGAMLMSGRRCALLRDHTIEAMPVDLVGQIYKPVDLDDPATVSTAIGDWIRNDVRQ